MYLQSLELLGFKSFAQKTALQFHRGVTAVVGPNGCGKSNVLDAIRWVLGEQSAKALRGGEMADVIFSGTDSRPALGMAEVSMTFAECEQDLGVPWHEVTITRRVFRDGASEYLLNKTPCRLRDIQQMFMDTGIGRSAYSIMEQGKIDSILSSRPEDRRAIFEEAAGITKFKSQRKEALRKLEYTEANLLRLNDVMKEVKRQIGSLQRQAGKARRYQALQTDLRVLETHWARHQFDELQSQIAAATEEIERIEKSLREHAGNVEAEEERLAGERREAEGLEAELTGARQQVQEIRNSIHTAEHEIAHNREKITEFQELIARYQLDIAAADEKTRMQQAQIESTDSEISLIAEALLREQQRLEAKATEANELRARRAEAEHRAQEKFAAISRAETRVQGLRREIAALAEQSARSETRLGSVRDELMHIEPEQQRLEAERGSTAGRLEASQLELESHQTEIHDAETALRDLRVRRDEVDQQRSDLARKLAAIESRLHVLQQLNEEGEGFSEGTQAVLRGLDQPDTFRAAIHGTLANHLEVDQEFIPAIEAALGQALQAVLVKNEDLAQQILSTLTQKKLGRATLLLPDLPLPDATRPPLPDGAIAWAIDKVRPSDAALPALRALLADVVLAPDLAFAIAAQKGIERPLRWVTPAGEVLTPPGLIHGGQAAERNQSLLQRKAQIQELDGEASALRADLAKVDQERSAIQDEIDASQQRAQELRTATQQLGNACSGLRGELAQLDRSAREMTQKVQNLSWEADDLDRRIHEASERTSALEREAADSAGEVASLQSELDLQSREVERLRAEEAAQNGEWNELRIAVATERQRQQSLQSQRAPMAARVEELAELRQRRESEIAAYRARTTTTLETIAHVEEELRSAQANIGDAESHVASLAEKRGLVAAAIDAAENSLRILRRQSTECQEQRSRQELKRSQIELRIENLTEQMQRRYQLDLVAFEPDHYAFQCTLRDQEKRSRRSEEAEAEPAAETPVESPAPTNGCIDWARVESLVREFSEKLEAMGPVNVDAIHEYDELEQRNAFLETQLTDLNNSKTELLDVIARINQTTKQLFAETFDKVRTNFREMFTELFGGGKADLLLLDENDPLESGIEIVAKPPGKQLQSISLLSGGEKTMTAVALLFSIYMVKPSPFCVLDEMDAPLDESNINRFIKILDRFVSQSQFIVITHNKRTIAKADVLYGVTMEEHGVSKLVGVKLARREESNEAADLMGTSNPVPVPSIAESFGKHSELLSETVQAG
jgi:chromosome segregation protein